MANIWIWILLSLFTENYAFLNYVSPQTKSPDCICMPFWQCKDDNNGFSEEDIGFENIRIVNVSVPMRPSCTGDFDVCCKIQCGQRSNRNWNIHRKLSKRILGGNNEADFAEFPWMLAILHDKTYRCGASLIHPRVALTAAHCVDNPEGHYRVRAGEWNWENNDEPLKHQERLSKKVIIHPQYHSSSLRNDIALLLLDQAFNLNENIGLICLPQQNIIFDYRNCIATGWGKKFYYTNNYQSVLKKVNLPTVPRTKCLKSLQENRLGPSFFLHKSFICAGGEANKDTCKGDGGSPLICPILDQPTRYEQVGIVSWGLTCGLKNTPGVYVNVALFSDWIYSELSLFDLDLNVYKY